MDVTKDNFEDVLPQILEDIESCTFLSIDTELTGLWRQGEPGQLCSQEEYYNLFLCSASDFICLQVGITLFKLNSVTKSYQPKSYKFNVFPHQYMRNSKYSFSCQASSLEFLVSHNFDFNKVFYQGIPYLNVEKEAQLSELLEERRYYKEKNVGKEQEKIDIPEEHKKCIEESCEKLASVLAGDAEEEARVPGLNAFIRRLIYQTVKERYPNGELLVDTRDGVMVARKGNIAGNIPKSQLDIDDEEVNKAVGFSKVIRAISKSGKLVIGHNMFLDLCHLIHNYLVMAPKTYTEFRGVMSGLFPLVLDTKFMSSSSGFKDLIANSTLNRLHSRMSESPFAKPDIEPVDGFSYPSEADNYHDAGFDSYVTGLCFISMFNYVGGTKDCQENVDFKSKMAKIKRFINRVYMNNSPDNHFHFGGQDPEPNRDHYFHVTFPKDWVANDIIQLFSPYGRININWINETSAWTCLADHSQASCAKESLCSKAARHPTGVIVSPFTKDTYKTVISSRKRASDNLPYWSSPHSKRQRSSRESSSLNRSHIETILEEKEEDGENSSTPNNQNSKSKYWNMGEQQRISNRSLPWERKKKFSFNLGSNVSQEVDESEFTTPKPVLTEGRKCSKPTSCLSEALSQDAAIAELEKDLDCDGSDKPFSCGVSWVLS